jgi:transcription elongation factor GreA
MNMNKTIPHTNGSSPAEEVPPRRSDRLPVTATTHRALKAELDRLALEKRHVLPERLRAAHGYGDGSSSDEYLAILEEAAVVEARMAKLEDILCRAVVVDPADSSDIVAIGSAVTVRDTGSAETVDYVIASAHAESAPGRVSAVSPVGEALLGRRPGESVTVNLPRGRTRELEVMAITQAIP